MEVKLKKYSEISIQRGDKVSEEVVPFWPILLDRGQLAAYVGVSTGTLSRICPVPPVSLGAKLLRWRRPDIDSWIMGLPSRLLAQKADQSVSEPNELAGDESSPMVDAI